MNKKAYMTPIAEEVKALAFTTLLQTLSAPNEGIHDGGEGEDDDDPTAKGREDDWGNLW